MEEDKLKAVPVSAVEKYKENSKKFQEKREQNVQQPKW